MRPYSRAPLRFGIVGAGRVASVHSRALQSLNDGSAVISAVADIEPEAAARLGQRLQCLDFESDLAMAESVALDAVIVCSPPATHREIACRFLQRNVAVLCEKPFGASLRDAVAMSEMATDFGAPLRMSSRFAHATDVLAARRLVAAGAIGDIMTVQNVFSLPFDAANNWRSIRAISGGGVLMDKGPQSLDLMRLFLGPPSEIFVVANEPQAGRVEASVTMHVRNRAAASGRSLLSWDGRDEQDMFARIEGSTGCIELGWTRSRIRKSDGEWTDFGPGYDQQQAFQSQLRSFISDLRSESAIHPSISDALVTAALLEAGYSSLHSGAWEAPLVTHTLDPVENLAPDLPALS